MSKISIGTSGYSYHEWVGPVYPEGTHYDDFLKAYSALFETVELNFSYYRMPTASRISGLIGKAGPSLRFSIKANESLTHKIDPVSWQDSAKIFMDAIKPLRDTGRLDAVLFQFPYSFHYEVDKRRYLNNLLMFFSDLPVAVEFRNHDWYNHRVIPALKERRAAFVSLDLPSLNGLPPLVDVVTAPFAYLRFHGRNGEHWWGSDAASRYNYLYSDTELNTLAERIKRIAGQTEQVFIYFNNHPRGQAVGNARSFITILEKAGLIT